tara:strand:+ start:219 stop:1109 length:891 start_codon:yes stop_codon:yes gene_type:complete
MRILITGIKSFVGQYLVKELKKHKKFKVFGCDLVRTNKNNIINLDIRDKNFYRKLPKDLDIIIHLAAISRDKDCSNDLPNSYMTNVVGTLNVIEAAKKLNIKKIIFASTEWVYPNSLASKKVDENTKLDITKLESDYAITKLISEIHLTEFYKKNKNFNVTILRFGIIYGERAANWSAVEAIYNNIKKNDKISVGSIKTSRKFIHIDDIVMGITKSINLKKFNIINLQGPELITLKKLIDISTKILKKKIKVHEKDNKNPSIRNVNSRISNKKIRFKPKITLKKGLLRFNNYLEKL